MRMIVYFVIADYQDTSDFGFILLQIMYSVLV